MFYKIIVTLYFLIKIIQLKKIIINYKSNNLLKQNIYFLIKGKKIK